MILRGIAVPDQLLQLADRNFGNHICIASALKETTVYLSRMVPASMKEMDEQARGSSYVGRSDCSAM